MKTGVDDTLIFCMVNPSRSGWVDLKKPQWSPPDAGFELLVALIEAFPFAAALATRTTVLAANDSMRARFGPGVLSPEKLLRVDAGLQVSALPVSLESNWFLLTASAATTVAHHVAMLAREWGLTPREQQVLEALADGASTRALAARLGLGLRTVESHVGRILLKSESESRTELVARLWQRAASIGATP